jgi:hypothetical protein
MKLTDSELRLECLRLATCSVKPSESGKSNGALDVATKFYEFMKGADIAPKVARKSPSPSATNAKARKTMARVASARDRAK